MNIKLAEGLLRRKELTSRLGVLSHVKQTDWVQVIHTRKAISDSTDDIVSKVPKFRPEELMAEINRCSMQLRFVDAAIQQANWTTDIEIDPKVMDDRPIEIGKTEG